MYLITGIILTGFLLFLIYASAFISSGIYLKALCRVAGNRKEVVLTFDDGVDPKRTPEVLDVLKKHNARGVFFLIGQRAEAYPDLVRRICDEGHQIGNHTYSHEPDFPLKGHTEMHRELIRTQVLLEKLSAKPVKLFRPPFGVTNPNIARAVNGLGYQTIGWSIRSFDTMNTPREKVLKRILRKLRPGAIILMHDDRNKSAELLDELLTTLQKRGYTTILIED